MAKAPIKTSDNKATRNIYFSKGRSSVNNTGLKDDSIFVLKTYVVIPASNSITKSIGRVRVLKINSALRTVSIEYNEKYNKANV